MRQGDPLRLSAGRLQWSTWALVGFLAVGFALAGSLEIDEFASGPAVIRFVSAGRRDQAGRTVDGAPGEGGRATASCLVIGYLRARHLSAIRPGATARFALDAPGFVAPIKLESVEPHLRPTDTVRRLLKEPTFSSGAEAMVAVVGRLDPCAVMNRGQRMECSEGLRGRIEVRLQSRKLISALVPGSSVPSP